MKKIKQLEKEKQFYQNQINYIASRIVFWNKRMELAMKENRLDLARTAEQKKLQLIQQGEVLWQKQKELNNQIKSQINMYTEVYTNLDKKWLDLEVEYELNQMKKQYA